MLYSNDTGVAEAWSEAIEKAIRWGHFDCLFLPESTLNIMYLSVSPFSDTCRIAAPSQKCSMGQSLRLPELTGVFVTQFLDI